MQFTDRDVDLHVSVRTNCCLRPSPAEIGGCWRLKYKYDAALLDRVCLSCPRYKEYKKSNRQVRRRFAARRLGKTIRHTHRTRCTRIEKQINCTADRTWAIQAAGTYPRRWRGSVGVRQPRRGSCRRRGQERAAKKNQSLLAINW